jgi:phosphatidylinositol 4-kinase
MPRSVLNANPSFLRETNKSLKGVPSLLRIAWAESPSLALQIAARFPSEKIRNDVRWLLLNFPEKALNEPESLEIMFGSSLPPDISFQLKVCSPQ